MDARTTSGYTWNTTKPANLSDGTWTDGGWGVNLASNWDLVLALFGLICAVGVTGNLLVCFVLLRVPSLRSNTSDFLVHLSLVDLVVCVLVIPFKIMPQMSRSPPPNATFWGQLRCRLYVSQYPFWVCALVSVFNLVVVSLERFAAIVHPHRYKRIFTTRKKVLMLGSCWLLALVTKSFSFLLYEEDPVSGCRFLGWPSRVVQATFGVYNFIMNMLGPFVLMISVQWKVISTLKKQVKILTDRGDISELNPADRRQMWQLRATQILVRTLTVFAVTFAVCWAPNQLTFLLYNFGAPVSLTTPFYHCSVILAVGNSCVNPIIYSLTNQHFRKGIRAAFRRGRRSGRVGDVNMATLGLGTMSTQFNAK